ncbi:hypothetical protein [Falsiroseomonas sp.]|uniref:hypothetical protein n=1 Tax=Falsiroseomonas sp. TaxID=2870721 RepID=UPI003F6F4507
MTQWVEHRWYGPVAVMEQVRASLPVDPLIIGALVPPLGEPLRALDGDAAISFLAAEALPKPEGVRDDRPETIRALQGVL